MEHLRLRSQGLRWHLVQLVVHRRDRQAGLRLDHSLLQSHQVGNPQDDQVGNLLGLRVEIQAVFVGLLVVLVGNYRPGTVVEYLESRLIRKAEEVPVFH